MSAPQQNRFSGPVTVFHERRLPESATPAGYAALIDAYQLTVPLPRRLAATGGRHRISETAAWRIYTPRHAPRPTIESHLTFALKYEGLDLAVLKRLFLAVGPGPVAAIVRRSPTGSYSRRLWFLYEWLTQTLLDLPDAQTGAYVPVVDPELQWASGGQISTRQRTRNNLPGTPEFCPLIFRTPALEDFVALNLNQRARSVMDRVPRDLLSRTAAFLLLKDSKSSYVIEGERPPQDRIQRWGCAIGEAGLAPLDADELLRLQRIVIGDQRFVHLGWRTEGGFVGEHDRETRAPIPNHISARSQDLASLVNGMVAFDHGAQELDPVMAAAMLAFGFIYIHPFEDGNGRIHRYLMHHVLARRGYNPPGVHFPVSAAILDHLDIYGEVLESYSRRLLPVVTWRPTPGYNVEILNDTADFYRYFDATPHAEFLYACVRQTIDYDLPEEARFLENYDRFRSVVSGVVDMPDRTFDNLFGFLRQNQGRLSRRVREKEFAALTDDEQRLIESAYEDLFGGANETAKAE